MKRDRLIRIFIWLFVIIFFSNVPPIQAIYRFILDENHYSYSNEDGSFTFTEFKSRDTKMMYRRFDDFKKVKEDKSDSTLYRLFWKNPLAYWRWGEYLFDKRYHLQYKNWTEIKNVRGYDLKYSNNFQDF